MIFQDTNDVTPKITEENTAPFAGTHTMAMGVLPYLKVIISDLAGRSVGDTGEADWLLIKTTGDSL